MGWREGAIIPIAVRPAGHSRFLLPRLWACVRRGSGRNICSALRTGAQSVPDGRSRRIVPIPFPGWPPGSSPTGAVVVRRTRPSMPGR